MNRLNERAKPEIIKVKVEAMYKNYKNKIKLTVSKKRYSYQIKL